jgi:hypothetical protein
MVRVGRMTSRQNLTLYMNAHDPKICTFLVETHLNFIGDIHWQSSEVVLTVIDAFVDCTAKIITTDTRDLPKEIIYCSRQ